MDVRITSFGIRIRIFFQTYYHIPVAIRGRLHQLKTCYVPLSYGHGFELSHEAWDAIEPFVTSAWPARLALQISGSKDAPHARPQIPLSVFAQMSRLRQEGRGQRPL